MKEAAGEANLTVVAIILIAVVVAVATPLVNSLMSTATKRSCCTDYGGIWEDNKCKQVSSTGTKTVITENTYYNKAKGTCATSK